ncbi:MAG: hypothetical protein ACI90V_009447, partial [Bacillariaceae sp.]
IQYLEYYYSNAYTLANCQDRYIYKEIYQLI